MPSQADDINLRFGQVVRQYRGQAGLSQEELADAAGLHRTYVSLLERGLRNPSLHVILMLAGALGVSAVQLLADIEQQR